MIKLLLDANLSFKLRTGNQSTEFIATILERYFNEIIELQNNENIGLLEIV